VIRTIDVVSNGCQRSPLTGLQTDDPVETARVGQCRGSKMMTTTFTTTVPSQELQAPILLSDEEIMLVAGGFSLIHYIESGAKAVGNAVSSTATAVWHGVTSAVTTAAVAAIVGWITAHVPVPPPPPPAPPGSI
jgi:hypothetical protein